MKCISGCALIALFTVMAAVGVAAIPAWAADGPAALDPQKGNYTIDELRQAFDGGQYPAVMQQLAKIQSSKSLQERYSAFDVALLRGDTLLQLRNVGSSLEAYTAAVKTAPNADASATPSAMLLLIKQSPGLMYAPKPLPGTSASGGAAPVKPAPISVVDLAQRKAALTALYQDQMAQFQETLKQVKKDGTLPQIATATQKVNDLHALELAATGAGTETQQIRQDLATRASEAMTGGLNMALRQIGSIRSSASTKVPMYNVSGGGTTSVMQARGLTAGDAAALRGIVADCAKAEPMAQEIAAKLQAEQKLFESTLALAQQVKSTANEALTTDYSAISTPTETNLLAPSMSVHTVAGPTSNLPFICPEQRLQGIPSAKK